MMLKVMFFVHRRPDLSHDEFRRHSRDVYAQLVSRLPGLRRHVLNFTVSDPNGPVPICDAVAELWFDDPEAFHDALASPEGSEVVADQPNFLEAPRTQMIMVEEVTVV
jgi:uncharacterized protein (TIGR02118 family)